MHFIHAHEFMFGYLLGLMMAILWGWLEVWGKRNPQTISSNVLLVVFGWLMVPIFSIGIAVHHFYTTIKNWCIKKSS